MIGDTYLTGVEAVLHRIRESQTANIASAASAAATAILAGRAAYLFGSGHSVIPCLDVFPRYGSFVGFCPILDPRLMWFNVVGPGGARELLWLERQEGYVKTLLKSYRLDSRDVMVIFSHGGLNAAPVEMAMEAKKGGLTVIGVTSIQNEKLHKTEHPDNMTLAGQCDILIDNCVPPDDAVVEIRDGVPKVGAASTVAVTAIAQALVAEVAYQLTKKGHHLDIFVSPNIANIPKEHNEEVFEKYSAWVRQL